MKYFTIIKKIIIIIVVIISINDDDDDDDDYLRWILCYSTFQYNITAGKCHVKSLCNPVGP